MLSNNEILSNYNHLKKLEQVLFLKKAEIETGLWKNIRKKLADFLVDVTYFADEELNKYLSEDYADVISFKVLSFTEDKYLLFCLGRDKRIFKSGRNDRFFFYIQPENFTKKELAQFFEFKKNLNDWKINGLHTTIYKESKKNEELNALFSFHDDKFYNLLNPDTLENISEIIARTAREEIKQIKTFTL